VEYVPYSQLSGRPHVIADGSSRRSTVLTLSHWPRSGTPWPLKADLSTEIAYRYLDTPSEHVDVDVVSNDHLDLDGFLSVFVLAADPDVVRRHRATIVEAARCGDFGTTTSSKGRRLAAAIGAATDEATSPFEPSVFALDRPNQVAALYQRLLEAVPGWLDDLEAEPVRRLWQDDEDAFDAAEAAFADGLVRLEEHPDVDAAVVRLDPSLRALAREFRSTIQGWGPLHPVAVHNRTERLRLVYVSGDQVGLLYRFESWVQLVSRTPMPRVDLAPLAAELGPAWSWAFPRNPNPPVPWLRAAGPTELAADEVVERILTFLREAPDPEPDVYDPRPYGPGVDLVTS
jgi:hypothetical protein